MVSHDRFDNSIPGADAHVLPGDADDIRRRFESSSILTRSSMLRSLYSDFESTSKLFALQSTVIYLLMEIFEGDHFFGLPEELGCLKEAAHAIRCMPKTTCL